MRSSPIREQHVRFVIHHLAPDGNSRAVVKERILAIEHAKHRARQSDPVPHGGIVAANLVTAPRVIPCQYRFHFAGRLLTEVQIGMVTEQLLVTG